ncbi:TetR family transcriptional regulator [Paenibacillus yonginensis]|uniref:TetR family transcriptional regulator n=2 Tax=Paenibacillus yonginensis TaxID=1462996 RepID=A0A1B1MX70_9BACL|nr:TetR family transcriptional regulator [Paenibacillus yonginensis]
MVNLQDPRVLRTRQLIREAFRELLRNEEFEAITIKDIAKKATINRGTFYAHYEDKYALLDEITEQFFYKRVPGQVMNAREFTAEICDQLILLAYHYIVDFYQICRMDSKSIAALVDEKIKKLLQQIIEGILSKGQNFDRHQIQIISAMIGSTIYSAAHQWLNVEDNTRTDLLINLVRPYVMKGLEQYDSCGKYTNGSPAAP